MPTDQSARTKPRSMRLRDDTLADLDLIAAALTERDGVARTRTDAVAYAARTVRTTVDRGEKKKLAKS